MSKLDFLSIENYKSIVDFKTHLSDRISVFIGASDSGKSNVVRAIRDFFFNAKSDSVVTVNQDRCRVSINDSTWEKGDGLNRYILPDGTYENVGRSSPIELKSHFKIDEVQFDDGFFKKINFIEQHEPKFFLSYTDSLNAKIIGKVSGIERIYIANKRLSSDIGDANYRLKQLNERLKSSNDELIKYQFVDELKSDVEHIAMSIDQIENTSTNCQTLKILIDDIFIYVNEKRRLELLEVKLDQQVFDDLDTILSCIGNCTTLNCMIEEVEELIQKCNVFKSIDIEQIDTKMLLQAKTQVDDVKMIKLLLSEIEQIKNSYSENDAQCKDFQMMYDELKIQLEDAVNSLDVCPLIKSTFKSGCKDLLIKI